MPHDNSVFHAVLKRLDWGVFEQAVGRHGAASRTRSFSGKSHLAAVLYAQFAGASSLREIEAALHSHAGRLHHLGVGPAPRSSLADANRNRPVAPFRALLHLRRLDQLQRPPPKAPAIPAQGVLI